MAVPRGWCLHGYRCGVEKKGTGGRWRREGDGDARGWERERGTYVHLSLPGVVDVLRIICVLCSLLHCALFSAPTAYYLLALTCNCIDLQYTTRTRPHPRPDGFFSSFRECIRTLPGGWKFATIGPARDGTTADATLCCAGMSRNFILPS